MSRVRITIVRFEIVDEDADDGSRVLARFDCQMGPLRVYNCELRSTPKGRNVFLPGAVTVAGGVFAELRKLAKERLAESEVTGEISSEPHL